MSYRKKPEEEKEMHDFIPCVCSGRGRGDAAEEDESVDL